MVIFASRVITILLSVQMCISVSLVLFFWTQQLLKLKKKPSDKRCKDTRRKIYGENIFTLLFLYVLVFFEFLLKNVELSFQYRSVLKSADNY